MDKRMSPAEIVGQLAVLGWRHDHRYSRFVFVSHEPPVSRCKEFEGQRNG
ncbi:hypothetical protein [Marinobacterium aestuariivivens]|uniref:Uncharacterized protein n=1 Tax=Marinobacterium aestuariivivens TaxID=1698799 RepID=A0ABW2A3M9_9GAMM